MTDYTQIVYEVRGEVAVITLNRPERLNAWTPTMAEEQVDAITRANDDPAVGAIVTTGAGRGFCAGADMQATFQSRIDGVDPGRDTAGGRGGMPAGLDWVAFVRAAKPMVAAINGAGGRHRRDDVPADGPDRHLAGAPSSGWASSRWGWYRSWRAVACSPTASASARRATCACRAG